MKNFKTLGQPLVGEKYVTQKERKKNNPKIADTTIRCSIATPKGSELTSLGPKINFLTISGSTHYAEYERILKIVLGGLDSLYG